MIPRPSRVLNVNIPSGRAGTVATVKWMMRLVVDGEAWPELRPIALQIVEPCESRNFRCMADELARWVGSHMKFINDAWRREQLQTVPYLLRVIEKNGYSYGDCDDYAILIAALAKSLGFPVKIRVIRYALQPGFSHVIPVVYVRDHGWIEYDMTAPLGEVPPLPRAEVADSPVIG